MLFQCWSTVYDAGPTLEQHCDERIVFAGNSIRNQKWISAADFIMKFIKYHELILLQSKQDENIQTLFHSYYY